MNCVLKLYYYLQNYFLEETNFVVIFLSESSSSLVIFLQPLGAIIKKMPHLIYMNQPLFVHNAPLSTWAALRHSRPAEHSNNDNAIKPISSSGLANTVVWSLRWRYKTAVWCSQGNMFVGRRMIYNWDQGLAVQYTVCTLSCSSMVLVLKEQFAEACMHSTLQRCQEGVVLVYNMCQNEPTYMSSADKW